MNVKYLFAIVAVAVAAVGAYVFLSRPTTTAINSFEDCVAAGNPVMESYPEQCRTQDGRLFVRDLSNAYPDLIKVDAPTSNAAVSSPLTVTGQARGTWYFEASFPVTLVDANGTVLAQVPAQAQDEWMTENFVPFKATLTFAPPATETGTLILHNDNPSGLPENDKEIRIPVRFKAPTNLSSAKFGDEVTLTVGATATFADGLTVTLKEINDSRCKPGVQCIWQGELAPVLSVSGGRFFKSLQTIQLGTVNNKTVTEKEYGFGLRRATESSATIVVVSGSAAGTSGVSGYIHVGPTCPVQQDPPDPQCADRAFMGRVTVKKGGVIVKEGVTKNGQFIFALAPGTYTVTASDGDALYPRCEEEVVTITENKFAIVDMSCDTGIR